MLFRHMLVGIKPRHFRLDHASCPCFSVVNPYTLRYKRSCNQSRVTQFPVGIHGNTIGLARPRDGAGTERGTVQPTVTERVRITHGLILESEEMV